MHQAERIKSEQRRNKDNMEKLPENDKRNEPKELTWPNESTRLTQGGLRYKWVRGLDHFVTQLHKEQGPFKAYTHRMGNKEIGVHCIMEDCITQCIGV